MWFAVFDGSPQAYQDIADNIAAPVHSHSMYVRRYFCARLHTSMEVMELLTLVSLTLCQTCSSSRLHLRVFWLVTSS